MQDYNNSSEEQQNLMFHRKLIPILNSVLWLAALPIGCYSEWSEAIDEDYQKICLFLTMYCTFMFEGGLIWWDIMAINYNKSIRLKDSVFVRTIFFNMALTLVVVVLFFVTKELWLMYSVMVTAAWLKYIICRITPKLDVVEIPYFANEYEVKELN
ncbi:MAG: hypothetical protein K2M87_02040 [Muribaculaceae bacterium]|nr:hypothetical protein [Muribaculaceae bacterium]